MNETTRVCDDGLGVRNTDRIIVGQAAWMNHLVGYDPAGAVRGPSASLVEINPAGVACGYIDIFVPPATSPARADLFEGEFSIALSPRLDRVTAEKQSHHDIELLSTRLPGAGISIGSHTEALSAPTALFRLTDPSAIREDLSNLGTFRAAGVSSIGVAWCRPTAFACGVSYRRPGEPERGLGLTGPGKELVAACDEVGILLDLAHLTLAGIEDVAAVSRSPLVISHSAVHELTRSSRSIMADHWAVIEDCGGVIGIAPEPGMGDPIAGCADQVEYALIVAAEEHVGLGSDLMDVTDGYGVCRARDVVRELLRRGLPEPTVRRIAWENWLRVQRRSEYTGPTYPGR